MSLFAVTREAGPTWTDAKGAFDQPGVDAHVAFMGGLADEGCVLFAGPLAGSEIGRIRVLLIAEAVSEDEVRHRLSHDPWAISRQLLTSSIEPWNLIVGADRLPGSRGVSPGRAAHQP